MIEHLAKDLFRNIQNQAQNAKELSESQIRVFIESAVRKLDLVSREEFDAQQAVLLRTRQKLEELEEQFSELQSKIEGK